LEEIEKRRISNGFQLPCGTPSKFFLRDLPIPLLTLTLSEQMSYDFEKVESNASKLFHPCSTRYLTAELPSAQSDVESMPLLNGFQRAVTELIVTALGWPHLSFI